MIQKIWNIFRHFSLDGKIILISILHRYQSSFEVTNLSATNFWSRIQNPGLQKSKCLALFYKKLLRHFDIKLRNQFGWYWRNFFFNVKLRSAIFTLYENYKFTEPLRSPLVCWNLTSRKKTKKLDIFNVGLRTHRVWILGLRGGLRDIENKKYRPSPFTGWKNHCHIHPTSFWIFLWS